MYMEAPCRVGQSRPAVSSDKHNRLYCTPLKASKMETGRRTTICTVQGEKCEMELNLPADQLGKEQQWSDMSPDEEDLIHKLHHLLGDKWGLIAGRIPGRTAEDVERYWRMMEKRNLDKNKVYKPVCLKPSPSFKFTIIKESEKQESSQV